MTRQATHRKDEAHKRHHRASHLNAKRNPALEQMWVAKLAAYEAAKSC